MAIEFLTCHRCGKTVSTGFTPVPTDTPDQGLIVRAWVQCPECIEAEDQDVCVWAADDDGVWTTTCDQAFVFIDGDPQENGMLFCCYCGQTLKARPYVDPPPDDDEDDKGGTPHALRLV